jgi:hypothetical protein
MLLAAPPNARTQASVPTYSIFGRSSLLPTRLKAKKTPRAGNGPTSVQAGLFAPKVAPSPTPDPFYNRVTELDYFKSKFSGEVDFVTVLVGPRNCGKSVSSAFLCWSACPQGGDGNCINSIIIISLLGSFKQSSYRSLLFIISCRDFWRSFFDSMSSRILGHWS